MPDLKKTDDITLRFKKVADRPGAMTVFGQSLNGPESQIMLEAGVNFEIRVEGGQLVLSSRQASSPARLTEGEECVAMLAGSVLGGIRDGERPRLYLRRLIDEVIRLQALEMERAPYVEHRGAGSVLRHPAADLVDANLKTIGPDPFAEAADQASREEFQKAKADIQAGQAARGEPQSDDAQEKF